MSMSPKSSCEVYATCLVNITSLIISIHVAVVIVVVEAKFELSRCTEMCRCLAACLTTHLKLLRFLLCKGMSCKEALRCFSSGAVHVTAISSCV